MEQLPRVGLDDFNYELPPERIAQYPLSERDRCRLLVADCRSRRVEHRIFAELPQILPARSLLVRNITRVVHARLFLQKPTGGVVELLLLAPTRGAAETVFGSAPPVEWECLLRGRRLRPGMELSIAAAGIHLRASLLECAQGIARLYFDWDPPELTLADILERLGHVPLPPYMRRRAQPEDRQHYQTVYARIPGSVAAPTAGLHFTERLLQELEAAGIAFADVCLHIGLDTFKPVQTTDVRHHRMHSEALLVSRDTLVQLRTFLSSSERRWLVAVGTTTVRTLESLYWHGVRLLQREPAAWNSPQLSLGQWDAYQLQNTALPPASEAIEALLEWLEQHRLTQVEGTTELLIMPGYRYQLCEALITNFHQPRSTLLLLVAALVGDFWRDIYAEALAEGYRFLSYGDASLLLSERVR